MGRIDREPVAASAIARGKDGPKVADASGEFVDAKRYILYNQLALSKF